MRNCLTISQCSLYQVTLVRNSVEEVISSMVAELQESHDRSVCGRVSKMCLFTFVHVCVCAHMCACVCTCVRVCECVCAYL